MNQITVASQVNFFSIFLSKSYNDLGSRVAELEVKYPTPTFPKFPTPTVQNFRLRLLNMKGMMFGC